MDYSPLCLVIEVKETAVLHKIISKSYSNVDLVSQEHAEGEAYSQNMEKLFEDLSGISHSQVLLSVTYWLSLLPS